LLETKLLIGRYIKFSLPQSPAFVQSPSGFQAVPKNVIYIHESTGRPFGSRTIVINDQIGAKTNRQFVWLPWVPLSVTEVDVKGMDVLTGPMSGCAIALYYREGFRCIAHIGTDIANPAQNQVLKTRWNTFVNASKTTVKAFKPFSATSFMPNQQPGEGAAEVFGLVASDDSFYSVFTYKSASGNASRIADIRQCTPLTSAILP
jgi:hypothetical protein